MQTPACNYCGEACELVARVEVDPSNPHGHAWACWPCKAWIGVVPNSPTMKPEGRLANAALHEARNSTVRQFTKMWKPFGGKHVAAYTWLANKMDIPFEECSFGKFDLNLVYQARAVIFQHANSIINAGRQ